MDNTPKTPVASIHTYEVHPAAAVFPLLVGDEYAKLKEHIEWHGQQVPIAIYDGKILDGRNRAQICEELGLVALVKNVDDEVKDPVEWVIGINLRRRHLDASQRAAIAADLQAIAKAQNENRLSQVQASKQTGKNAKKCEVRDRTARAMGVSPRLVQDAEKVVNDRPDLAKKVKAGDLTVGAALREMSADKLAAVGASKPELSFIEQAKVDNKRLDEIIREIHKLGSELQTIAQWKPKGKIHNPFLASHAQRVEDYVQQLKTEIKQHTVPYEMCPRCGGDKCKDCKQAGWMPRAYYDRIPEAERKVFEKGAAK